MKKYLKTTLYILVAILVGVTAVYATSKLTPPGTVSNTMYSLTDIYNLAAGTTTTEGSGTIETTPNTVEETGKTLTEVYTAISGEIAKLSSSVIASGTTAFGIEGDTNVVDTSDANATENDIISPKTAYVDGVKITGVATAGYTYPSKPLQTFGTSNYCTDDSGNIISCTGTGQDGEYQSGQARSYTDNGDLTITDNATGLMWQKCVEGLSGTDCTTGSATTMTAVNFGAVTSLCENLTLAGHTDWRLPNISELFSLVTFERIDPPINMTYFPNSRYRTYWSSTKNFNDHTQIFYVSSNSSTFVGYGSRSSGASVRCVRNLP